MEGLQCIGMACPVVQSYFALQKPAGSAEQAACHGDRLMVGYK